MNKAWLLVILISIYGCGSGQSGNSDYTGPDIEGDYNVVSVETVQGFDLCNLRYLPSLAITQSEEDISLEFNNDGVPVEGTIDNDGNFSISRVSGDTIQTRVNEQCEGSISSGALTATCEISSLATNLTCDIVYEK